MSIKVIAIIAARNEQSYIGRCFEHLRAQDVEFILIDNGSTDRTVQIAESFRGNGLIDVIHYPYQGYYDWVGLLSLKEKIAANCAADWVIHQDADEILESPRLGETLVEAFALVQNAGYNAVNFDEFCFVPFREDQNYEGKNYVELMRHYFFFEPHSMRLIRAWKGGNEVSLSASGGHDAGFNGRKIWPENFVLRHYIGLSLDFLRKKYTRNRQFSEQEVNMRGWHGWRSRVLDDDIIAVDQQLLVSLDDGASWDRSRPYKQHPFVRASFKLNT